jgi:hypothetical protein
MLRVERLGSLYLQTFSPTGDYSKAIDKGDAQLDDGRIIIQVGPKAHFSEKSPRNNGTNIDGNWKCSGQQDVIPTCPPSGMVTAVTAVTAALQPKDLVEAVHPST